MLCGQVAAYAAHHRVCAPCGVMQPFKNRRTRRLQTLFGTVEVEAPRLKVCRCRLTEPAAAVTVSPVCALLTSRCMPELERVQAELGVRTSFRDGARILDDLLPASLANHESVRTRTHAVALRIEAADRRAAAEVTAVRDDTAKAVAADASRPVVMLDGAYIRAVPGHFGHQVRSFEAICGKVEQEGHPTRRFAVVRSVVKRPHPCCVQRCTTRAGGRATRSPRSATATPGCRPWCARPRAARWSSSWTGSTFPCVRTTSSRS